MEDLVGNLGIGKIALSQSLSRDMKISRLYKLADALNVPIGELFRISAVIVEIYSENITGKYETVIGIDTINKSIDIDVRGTRRKVEFYRVKPIHLTEELLLKCGFKEKTHGFCKGGVRCSIGGSTYLEYYDEGVWLHVQYLHELQNYWFYIVGEELEVKL